jgi:RNA polymerase sigma-70 factor (ECF subfamily)
MGDVSIRDLYEQYGFVIYGRCRRILRSEEDARDAMQSVFLKLVEHQGRLRDRQSVVAWLYTTATNHCFNVLRQAKRTAGAVDPDTIAGADPEGRMEARTVIRLLMGTQSKAVQQAVYFTHVEGLDQKEIQKVTGQSPATVRRNLGKFKKHVERWKRGQGVRGAEHG